MVIACGGGVEIYGDSNMDESIDIRLNLMDMLVIGSPAQKHNKIRNGCSNASDN